MLGLTFLWLLGVLLWYPPDSPQGSCQGAVSLVRTCILSKDFSGEDKKTGEGRLEVRRSRRGSPCALGTSFGIPSHRQEADFGPRGSHRLLAGIGNSRNRSSWGLWDQILKTCSPLKSTAPYHVCQYQVIKNNARHL